VSSTRFDPSITNGLSVTTPLTTIVPPGSIYEASSGFSLWAELR